MIPNPIGKKVNLYMQFSHTIKGELLYMAGGPGDHCVIREDVTGLVSFVQTFERIEVLEENDND